MSTETKTKGTGKRTTTKELEQKQMIAKLMYMDGHTDIAALAGIIGVADKTMYRWCNEGKWKEYARNEIELEMQIKRAAQLACLAGLEAFAKDPKNTDLQSLVFMLKDFNKKMEPSKELNNYIILFADQLIQYCHERGLEPTANVLQENLHDLAEWLRVKNNG